MMWNNMMQWHGESGGAWMFGPLHLLWWILVIAGIVALVRWSRGTGGRRDGARGDSSMSILRERFARGEIDKAEFDARKRDLS